MGVSQDSGPGQVDVLLGDENVFLNEKDIVRVEFWMFSLWVYFSVHIRILLRFVREKKPGLSKNRAR